MEPPASGWSRVVLTPTARSITVRRPLNNEPPKTSEPVEAVLVQAFHSFANAHAWIRALRWPNGA